MIRDDVVNRTQEIFRDIFDNPALVINEKMSALDIDVVVLDVIVFTAVAIILVALDVAVALDVIQHALHRAHFLLHR